MDNIDLIRGLIIKDDYLKWKNNYKYVKLDDTSLEKPEFVYGVFDEVKLEEFYHKYPEIKRVIDEMDSNYLDQYNNIYVIGDNIVSRNRILRNLCNYKGKGEPKDILKKALDYQSNIKNSEEVFSAIMPNIEMGDESVKLSQRL